MLSIVLCECFHRISKQLNVRHTKTLSMGRLALFLASAPNKLKMRRHIIIEQAVSPSEGLGISASVSLCDAAVCYTRAPSCLSSDRSVVSITQRDKTRPLPQRDPQLRTRTTLIIIIIII